jgi:hypothetical protein
MKPSQDVLGFQRHLVGKALGLRIAAHAALDTLDGVRWRAICTKKERLYAWTGSSRFTVEQPSMALLGGSGDVESLEFSGRLKGQVR